MRPPAVDSAGVSRGPRTARTSRSAVQARDQRRVAAAVEARIARAHEDALGGRGAQAAASIRASARADSPVPVSEPVRDLTPVSEPANRQPATKTSQRAMVVRGRRADAVAIRRMKVMADTVTPRRPAVIGAQMRLHCRSHPSAHGG